MRHAIEVSKRGFGSISPNPAVGAVAVRDGEIIGEGWHAKLGGPHAERSLIANIGPEACRGADLYVTLEPCSHHGRTPPCGEAVLEVGFARVFVAVDDPNPLVSGGSYKLFEEAGIPVLRGVEEAAAREVLAGYLCRMHAERALATAKWAMTADGKIATESGDSKWISGDETRAATRRERGRYDAILIGRGTAEADRPALTSRTEGVPDPMRVVLDSNLSISRGNPLVATAEETPLRLIASARHADDPAFKSRRHALEEMGVLTSVVRAADDGRVDPAAVLKELCAQGVNEVLVEGGPTVQGAFFDAGCLDRVQVIVAPKLAGGAGAPGPIGGRGVPKMADASQISALRSRNVGSDWILEGALTAAGRGEWPDPAAG